MGRIAVIQSKAKVALCVLVSVCMAAGLFPAIALADTTLRVQVEKPAQVNEVVPVGDGVAETSGADADAADSGAVREEPGAGSRTPEAETPTHITTQVPVGGGGDVAATETILVDGLAYEIDHESNTAALTGWCGSAPAGDLAIPSQVADGSITYDVTSIGKAAQDTSVSDSRKTLGGGCISALLNCGR